MATTSQETIIIDVVLRHYPACQAIYLFGSFGTVHETPSSDVDVAILLPHSQAKTLGPLDLSVCRGALEDSLGRSVDLLNARILNTVMQIQVIQDNRRIYTGDAFAADEFEMLTVSFYQKLNEERRYILEDIKATGRVLDL